jgi:pyruvate dehydrogenase complex dehydrogenase (E1) component
VDAESIAIEALYQLTKTGDFSREQLANAIEELDYDPEKPNPLTA